MDASQETISLACSESKLLNQSNAIHVPSNFNVKFIFKCSHPCLGVRNCFSVSFISFFYSRATCPTSPFFHNLVIKNIKWRLRLYVMLLAITQHFPLLPLSVWNFQWQQHSANIIEVCRVILFNYWTQSMPILHFSEQYNKIAIFLWNLKWSLYIGVAKENTPHHFTFVWPCIVTNFFIIKPNRCTNFTNLF